MKKFQFLLLDANVVIFLFETGIWTRVVDLCDIYIAESVFGESLFYKNKNGALISISESDLSNTKRFEVQLDKITEFLSYFDRDYADRMDPGELESLAFMHFSSDEFLICSSDAIVFKVLGNIGKPDQGISLEHVLDKIGLSRNLPWQFSEIFRKKYTLEGVRDRQLGFGRQ